MVRWILAENLLKQLNIILNSSDIRTNNSSEYQNSFFFFFLSASLQDGLREKILLSIQGSDLGFS